MTSDKVCSKGQDKLSDFFLKLVAVPLKTYGTAGVNFQLVNPNYRLK